MPPQKGGAYLDQPDLCFVRQVAVLPLQQQYCAGHIAAVHNGIGYLCGAVVALNGLQAFAGNGNSAQSNQLQGQLTVRVVQDLGNGNLLVRGDKQLRLNQGDEMVQVQGIVRRTDIGADNRVTSDRVADARIVYGGRGTLARSNAMGWLGRFFNSALFPY